MLTYEIYQKTGPVWYFKFYPEGKDSFGIVSIDITTGECIVVQNEQEDARGEYIWQIIERLRRGYSEGFIKERGMVAWY